MNEPHTQKTLDFIHQLAYEQLPEAVIEQAKICLLDLLGVAVAGASTEVTEIMSRFVQSQYPGDIPLLFGNASASAAGASLYGAMRIDSVDAHDGQVLTKGHVGVSILPGLLAQAEQMQLDGKQFLTLIVLGYEIATRAGIALHATADDYHTSGAWNSLGVAAVVSRLRGLSHEQTWEALGTAEYYGPRSQMMRCVDEPTMVKDGSGWGALAGMSAALLAEAGFTGAPAVTIRDQEVVDIWADLGERWYILEQYFKAYPVCRWAQPSVEAIRQIRRMPGFDLESIEKVELFTFHQGVRLGTRQPTTTDQAQYSLTFSVASALIDDIVTAQAVAETEEGLHSPQRIALCEKITAQEVDSYNALFPAERWAHARITFSDGSVLESEPCIARGNPENPLTKQELVEKYRTLASPYLTEQKMLQIERDSLALEQLDASAVRRFMDALAGL